MHVYLFGHPLAAHTEDGFSKLGCGGLAIVGTGDQGYFSSKHMCGDDLVYVLVVTRTCRSSYNLVDVCFLLDRDRKYIFKALHRLDVIL